MKSQNENAWEERMWRWAGGGGEVLIKNADAKHKGRKARERSLEWEG